MAKELESIVVLYRAIHFSGLKLDPKFSSMDIYFLTR